MAYNAYKNKNLKFTSKQLHAGYNPKEHNNSKTVPIYQNTAFQVNTPEEAAKLFSFQKEGYTYGRYSNPTITALEKRIEALEGEDVKAVNFASGMAATANTLLNLAETGDEIIASNTLYGGNTTVLKKILPQYGIKGVFVKDENDPKTFENAITKKTKGIFIESLGNPHSSIIDFEKIKRIAKKYDIPFIIDNTFATPYLFPASKYADIIIYSASKYLSGHGIVIGGIVVDCNSYNFLNGKYKMFESFYENSKKLLGTKKIKEHIFSKRLKIVNLTDLGACMTPHTAFYIIQGIETLSLRLDKHNENAEAIANFLDLNKNVLEVNYPSLKSSPYNNLSKKYFKKGVGGILSFTAKGGYKKARNIVMGTELFDYMVNVGDTKSLITHAITSTHYGQPEEILKKINITDNTIRLSVGIEDKEDLIKDLSRVLK
ncbi:MAG: aminotransferase class I/II-fold pyridoxal phosphate-dependent enzyme [Clostridiales Family XIII bacterium]|jgi:O-acetylhomoserine (thiol)-lyase|nr:aminotransferase class I/II-fold pyridoxal phosphate-dependent enzyme [Clostridiales Family XIII bacterium]